MTYVPATCNLCIHIFHVFLVDNAIYALHLFANIYAVDENKEA